MTLPDGYSEIASGKIASVVTYMEMRQRPALAPVAAPAGLEFRRVLQPDPAWYRQLYRLVGEPWFWFSRLHLGDEQLVEVIHHPLLEIYALTDNEEDKGLLELDRREPDAVEISSFGLASSLMGRGAGRYLMAMALEAAWVASPERVWLHTCTLDSPKAMDFYRRSGFVAYRRAVEVADDPRLTGAVAETAAPHLPIIR